MMRVPAPADSPAPLTRWPLGLQRTPWPWLGRGGGYECVRSGPQCHMSWLAPSAQSLVDRDSFDSSHIILIIISTWGQQSHPPPANQLSADKSTPTRVWKVLVVCWEHKTYDARSLQYQQHCSGTFVCWHMLHPANGRIKPCGTHLEGSWKAKATLQTNPSDKCWKNQEPVNVFAR